MESELVYDLVFGSLSLYFFLSTGLINLETPKRAVRHWNTEWKGRIPFFLLQMDCHSDSLFDSRVAPIQANSLDGRQLPLIQVTDRSARGHETWENNNTLAKSGPRGVTKSMWMTERRKEKRILSESNSHEFVIVTFCLLSPLSSRLCKVSGYIVTLGGFSKDITISLFLFQWRLIFSFEFHATHTHTHIFTLFGYSYTDTFLLYKFPCVNV